MSGGGRPSDFKRPWRRSCCGDEAQQGLGVAAAAGILRRGPAQSGAESEVPPPGAPRHRVVWGAGAAPRRAWAVFLESQANRFAGAVRRDENGPSLACLRRGLYRQFDSAGCRCATQPGPRPAVSSDDGRRYGVVNLVCRPGCQLLWQTQFEVAY